jgi:hypothetical protein
MKLLLFFLLFASYVVFPSISKKEKADSSVSEKKIALCVSGQSFRWQPQHLFYDFIIANLEDQHNTKYSYQFYFFFNIQISKNASDKASLVFNTDLSNTFAPSPISLLSFNETSSFLADLFTSSTPTNNEKVHLASLTFRTALSQEELLQIIKVPLLDRITQYINVQTTLLNMYYHQVQCISQIINYEKNHQFKFDYIISTREDVYFFRPILLSSILPNLRSDLSNYNSIKPKNAEISITPFGNTNDGNCDIIYKKCLNFWGFNMRFYILSRSVAIQFLGNRFSYYRYLSSINRTIENPERFELTMASALRLIGCPYSVEDYPVTAARHYYEYQYCFIWFEVDRCVPAAYQTFVKDRMCLELKRKYLLSQPNLIKQIPLKMRAQLINGFGNLSLTEVSKQLRFNLNYGAVIRYQGKVNELLRELKKEGKNENSLTKKEWRLLLKEKMKTKWGSAPKTMQRLAVDPFLVESTWIDRDYEEDD